MLASHKDVAVPPSLIKVIETFCQRAKVPMNAPAEKIWQAVDGYLKANPLNPKIVQKLNKALKEDSEKRK
jgi:hypothetical protein